MDFVRARFNEARPLIFSAKLLSCSGRVIHQLFFRKGGGYGGL